MVTPFACNTDSMLEPDTWILHWPAAYYFRGLNNSNRVLWYIVLYILIIGSPQNSIGT